MPKSSIGAKMITTGANSVRIPMIQTSCMTSEFDNTYPIHLNGIISPEDFQHSISNINRSFSSSKFSKMLCIFIVLWMIAGLIMIITGGITAVSSFRTGISPLVIVGVAMWAGGILIIGFGCMAIQSRRMQRLREAVANESVKYSSASRPASWRIDTFQWYGWQRRNVTYNLVIDLEPNFAMAQNVYPTPSYSTAPPAYQQNKRPESSPHDNNQVQPVTYCSKCGAARQDYAGNFCSSCGQSYHKY
ncbi:unnamed protein product [Didymodactylos carnosus]|uniref:Uncharacterized protein n=1 Tax=Didymodactylos carnosus TaxID=1234261 RepID=A0A815JLH6_9BILA|nr:unnamed protein product [Didymodactylos carnosus]CAF4275843.1 unnamed protein product [Didymodactylos carnosus]